MNLSRDCRQDERRAGVHRHVGHDGDGPGGTLHGDGRGVGPDWTLPDHLGQLVGSQGRQRLLGVELPGAHSLQAADGTLLSVPVAATAGVPAVFTDGQGTLMAQSLVYYFNLF